MSDCPRICVIGAGISGICSGVQLKKNGLNNFTIFDDNEEVGGTWLVNTYPGCACDIPSCLYSFSFHPNYNWTSNYPGQPEILEYVKEVARTNNLYEHIKFHHQIKEVSWDETIQKWRVVIYDKNLDSEFETIFEIIIGAVGPLRYPNIPKEFESFKGPMMHSARWDPSIKLEGKTVGIVGSGASAIQIIPAIAKSVKKLLVYQRHTSWVAPKPRVDYYSWVKWILTYIPFVNTLFRVIVFFCFEFLRLGYTYNSILNKIFTLLGNLCIIIQVGNNPKMIKKLLPKYAFGNKQLLCSSHYVSSMMLPNVQLIRSHITEIREDSIVTRDGVQEQMDVLILATGFKVQDFFSPLKIRGKSGIDVMALWKTESPSTYLGIVSSVMPNYFMILGVNAVTGYEVNSSVCYKLMSGRLSILSGGVYFTVTSVTNSAIFAIECHVNWTVKVIKEIIRRGSTGICVTEEAERTYTEQVQEALKLTVWHRGEHASWYRNSRGVVTLVNPSYGLPYWNRTRSPDFTQLNFY